MMMGKVLKVDMTPRSDFHSLYCKPFNNGCAALGPPLIPFTDMQAPSHSINEFYTQQMIVYRKMSVCQ